MANQSDVRRIALSLPEISEPIVLPWTPQDAFARRSCVVVVDFGASGGVDHREGKQWVEICLESRA
jgi:hypothetical protein